MGTVIWDRPALADSSLGRALHRAQAEQTAGHTRGAGRGSRGTIEVRAYPSDDGLTVLLRENALQGHTAQILDGMGEAFLGCDHEWHITHINERADRYLNALGFRRADLLGLNVWQAFPSWPAPGSRPRRFGPMPREPRSSWTSRSPAWGGGLPSGSRRPPTAWSATPESWRKTAPPSMRSRPASSGFAAWSNPSTTWCSGSTASSAAWTPSVAGWSGRVSARPI